MPAQGAATLARRPDGSWPALPGAAPVTLSLAWPTATGQVRVALPGASPEAQRLLVQTALTDASGKTVYSGPRLFDPSQASPARLAELKRTLARRSMERLGPLAEDDDPKTPDGVPARQGPKTHAVTVTLPPGVFSLSPKALNKQNKPLHNAPRVLAEVTGDFLASVQVSGDIDPGIDPPTDPRGRKLPFCFQGGGLLLYQDKANYVRLERSCRSQRASLVRELLVEVVRGGQEIDYYYIALPGDPKAPMDLILMRKNGRIRCLFSFDGRLAAFREFAVEYPEKVHIGLTAANLAKKPFTARFEGFVLLDDKTKLDEFTP